MNKNNFHQSPPELRNRCPYCYEPISSAERIRRKVIRVCKCKKCGKIVDERFVVW